jgi:arylsulfatase A-like enzyme
MVRQQVDRPNVVVFFTDQQRWDTTGLHGNPLDLTPNLDRMARRGTHLHNAFTPQPLCGPARSSLQTGMYATTTGCWRNGIPLPQRSPTLATYLQDAGYLTAYIGKWHLAERDPVPNGQRGGYEYWLGVNTPELCSDSYDALLYDDSEREVRLPGYRVDALTDAAIRYIDAHQHDRFYLFLSLLEPHHQNSRDDYPAPDGYAERYEGKWMPVDLAALGGSAQRHLPGYYGMVRRIDEALGRLLDALRSLELLGRTIVLFASDHGCHFKTRNGEYKRSPHEASIRIPVAISGPGFEAGGQIRELVSLVDLPPTLLDAAGLELPTDMQGRSLLALLRGERGGWPQEMFFQVSESEVGRGVRTGRWKYYVVAPDMDGQVVPGAGQYVERYLYDLVADPWELDNLVELESYRDMCTVMRERLVRWMTEVGEDAPGIESVPSRAGGQRRVLAEEAGL